MVVISVDVPERIAKKFPSNKIISSEDLYQELDSNGDTIVDFGKNGIGKEEFRNYLSNK